MHRVFSWVLSRPWRQVLVLFLSCLLFTTLWAQAGQAQLADHILRLHVVANSDSSADQALKLQVRDRVLIEIENCLHSCTTRQEAVQRIQNAIPLLAGEAEEVLREQGCTDSVQVTLGQVWYPTRQTGALTLPAGNYCSLRVVIGAGAGHNWWCVVFPSLSLPAVTETALPVMGLTGEDYALITAEAPVYRFKLRTAELLGSFLHRINPESPCGNREAVID